MVIVGLTGSIASGKSTVASFFKDCGAYVIDWDVLAREVVNPPLPAWQAIVEHFGPEVLKEDLTLDRQKLGEIVFQDPKRRELLNQIVHPEVFREDDRLTQEIQDRDPNAIIIKDAPLLIELGLRSTVDKVVVVYANESQQLERLLKKGLTPQEAKQRIASQIPVGEKVQSADFVIYNDGSLEETRRQVEKIFSILSAVDKDRSKEANA